MGCFCNPFSKTDPRATATVTPGGQQATEGGRGVIQSAPVPQGDMKVQAARGKQSIYPDRSSSPRASALDPSRVEVVLQADGQAREVKDATEVVQEEEGAVRVLNNNWVGEVLEELREGDDQWEVIQGFRRALLLEEGVLLPKQRQEGAIEVTSSLKRNTSKMESSLQDYLNLYGDELPEAEGQSSNHPLKAIPNSRLILLFLERMVQSPMIELKELSETFRALFHQSLALEITEQWITNKNIGPEKVIEAFQAYFLKNVDKGESFTIYGRFCGLSGEKPIVLYEFISQPAPGKYDLRIHTSMGVIALKGINKNKLLETKFSHFLFGMVFGKCQMNIENLAKLHHPFCEHLQPEKGENSLKGEVFNFVMLGDRVKPLIREYIHAHHAAVPLKMQEFFYRMHLDDLLRLMQDGGIPGGFKLQPVRQGRYKYRQERGKLKQSLRTDEFKSLPSIDNIKQGRATDPTKPDGDE